MQWGGRLILQMQIRFSRYWLSEYLERCLRWTRDLGEYVKSTLHKACLFQLMLVISSVKWMTMVFSKSITKTCNQRLVAKAAGLDALWLVRSAWRPLV